MVEECSLGDPIIVRKFCGYEPPTPVISPCNAIKLIFHTDGSVSRTGFRAEYRVFERGKESYFLCFYVLRSLQNNSGKNTLCVTIALNGTGKLQLYNLVASN